MTFQYTYHHTCAHVGIGPLATLSPGINQPPTFSPPHNLTTTHSNTTKYPTALTLTFPCPFCTSDPPPLNNSIGVLALLTSSAANPHSDFPDTWRVLRACDLKDVTIEEWSAALEVGTGRGSGGFGYRHLAWIAKPEGVVKMERVGEGRGLSGVLKTVSTKWRVRIGREMETTRFEGLTQKLRGVMAGGEMRC